MPHVSLAEQQESFSHWDEETVRSWYTCLNSVFQGVNFIGYDEFEASCVKLSNLPGNPDPTTHVGVYALEALDTMVEVYDQAKPGIRGFDAALGALQTESIAPGVHGLHKMDVDAEIESFDDEEGGYADALMETLEGIGDQIRNVHLNHNAQYASTSIVLLASDWIRANDMTLDKVMKRKAVERLQREREADAVERRSQLQHAAQCEQGGTACLVQ